MTQSYDLQARVAELERKVEWLMQRAYVSPATGTPTTRSDASAEILDLVRSKKIAAVKQYRVESGVGLREAKDFVDKLG